ncbi:MAG: 1,4-alpha-glucan branching protein GlgB [Bacillota bacterium]
MSLENRDSFFSEEDLYLFHEGNNFYSYKMMGAHPVEDGVFFSVWAPNAQQVSVVGDFNNWNGQTDLMKRVNSSGIWSLYVSGLTEGEKYKYQIVDFQGQKRLKADPYAFFAELRPKTASRVYDINKYSWSDERWLSERKEENVLEEPINIYELHPGSWRKKEDGSFYNYRELAHELADYLKEMGYTHVELMPINEHPYDRSWGYQITGYFAVTSRYGEPDDFKYFVDHLHQKGIGVILDWVPGHFCKDDHGLRRFDGTPLYEYSDSRKAEKEEWGTLTFDYSANEVQSFLISNAVFWFEEYHIDGIRVDAVASMIYLNFGKEDQNEITNKYGGTENLEAIALLKKLNKTVFEYFPGILMIAEESSEWPLVTAPPEAGGLGFNFKWNMGWMNDMLKYMETDSIYRKWNHNLITFSMFYAFAENFILPVSHDEVVYGKKSLLNKMPGDYWQKFANFRVFMGYMMTHPGKKLLFMGSEFAQFDEWKDLEQLDWELLEYEKHGQAQNYVKDLNNFYLNNELLWKQDHKQGCFNWIDANNSEQSIISFLRKSNESQDLMLVVCNFTPEYYDKFQVGVPRLTEYREVFNSDLDEYGGSGKMNSSREAVRKPFHDQPFSIEIKVPPLGMVIFKPEIK